MLRQVSVHSSEANEGHRAHAILRKVKCEALNDDKSSCKQCAEHGVECKPRTRKRKASSLGENGRQQGSDATTVPAQIPADRDAPNGSSNNSKRHTSSTAATGPPKLPQRSSSVSVPELFVNHDSTLEYSPGSSEQTDTTAHDRFRNASFISRSAILGEDFQDIDHAHPERTMGDEKVSTLTMKTLRLHGAFDLPNLALRQSLIEAYIERCYTWMPVIDLSTFNRAGQGADSSFLLLQAVLLVGALMRPDVCTKAFCDRQYARVKALILSGYERHPLNILAALCLVQWYTPSAPRDISTDVPRFWNTYAVGLGQQMGLQRGPTSQESAAGLRNRIWWTMVARDNTTASAHGRPRIIQPEDCTGSLPTVEDFDVQNRDSRADIWTKYVGITRIFGDLCQYITRRGEASAEDKQDIGLRMQTYLNDVPEHLQLYSPSGLAQSYNLEVAQLHIPILVTITILFRPRTVYQLSAGNAGSVTAAFLSFRVFQAIQLREHTRYLGSPFAWHLLVTAIPLLSCTKVSALRNEANEALDSLETVLETLGRVRPAAANNLRSVKAIRKAMDSNPSGPIETAKATEEAQQNTDLQYLAGQLLRAYGIEALQQFEQVKEILSEHHRSQADRTAQAAAHTLSRLSGAQDPNADIQRNGYLSPGTDAYLQMSMAEQDIQNAFTSVFEDDTLSTSWMMRDWLDELQM